MTITRTTRNIVDGAFKKAGMFTEDRDTPGFRLKEGIYYLNSLLDSFANGSPPIPYDKLLTFNLIVGKREYSIGSGVGFDVTSNLLIAIKYITLKDGDSIFPVRNITDTPYYYNSRNDAQSGKPSKCFIQRSENATFLNFFIKSDKTYECTIKGKFVLDHVDENTILDQVPARYHLFLEYALARELSANYPSQPWSVQKEKIYQELLIVSTGANDINLNLDIRGTIKGHRNFCSDYSTYWS